MRLLDHRAEARLRLQRVADRPRLETLDQVRDFIEADTLAYLSLEGLLRAVKPAGGSYCTSCYTGRYPVAIPCNEQAYLQLALKAVE